MGPDDPVALVTGAARRVGRAIAIGLANAGYRVWLHYYRSAEHAQELGREPWALGCVGADLALSGGRDALAARVMAADGPGRGRLDLLVNNAASFERGALANRTDADLERVLALNLVGPVGLTRRLAPALADRVGASVVNIADVAGFHPWPEYLDHCTSKAGLLMATRAMSLELAPVRVNAVAPGTVAWPERPEYAPGSPARAEMLAAQPLRTIGRPQDVAHAVLYLAGAEHVTGDCVVVDGGRLAAAGGKRP